jgi:LPXTG-motif cell wall-anchored protein
MNFDFQDTELLFSVDTVDDVKVFSMAFKAGDEFVPTVWMNSHGLFQSEQMQFPEMQKVKELKGNQYYIGDVSPKVASLENIASVLEFIDDKQLVNRNVTVHHLMADMVGEAAVVEAGDTSNRVIKMDGKYMVMTNFTQADFVGKSASDVNGVGSDRYKTACDILDSNLGKMSPEIGWEVLKKTRQSGMTQCSMLMDPSEKSVQFILKDDGERIWRLDLESGIIEGTSADGMRFQTKLGEGGILASELRILSPVLPQENTEKQQLPSTSDNTLIIVVVFGSLIVMLGIWMIWNKRKSSNITK